MTELARPPDAAESCSCREPRFERVASAARSLPNYFTSTTTTGSVTAASTVPSATAPDTGFTSR